MILIVDDDRAIRLSLGLMLRQAKMEYVEASDEPSALSLLRLHNPDIVLLDLNLTPSTTGRQGIEMLRKIKVLRPECEVILMSAWGTIPLAVEGMNLGAADFITKPWRNADVLAKIRAILARIDAANAKEPPTLEDMEREAVRNALAKCDGHIGDAAQLLGITRQALYRRLEKYGMK